MLTSTNRLAQTGAAFGPGGDALARRAAGLLIERCGSCHGPDSEEPKAVRGWADAWDLATTVADPELIVPGDPDDSWLFATIEDEEMPPSDSDVAPLTEEERGVIAEWIRAGAELPSEAATTIEGPPADSAVARREGAETPSTAPKTQPKPAASWMKQPWPKWAGRFHPTVVHFPIALLTAALLAELLAKLLRKPELQPASTFCYTLGALSSVPSVAFGWLLAESTTHRGDELDYHRWLGVALAVVSLLGLRAFCTRPGTRLPLLLLLAALAGITGHLGGSLSYGTDWLALPK